MPTNLILRPAMSEDAAQLAETYWLARDAAQPAMPPLVRSREEIRQWIRSWSYTGDVWLAETPARVVGLARFPGTWLDDLYVHPDTQREGVGRALLEVVQNLRPHGFCLWVFQSNQPARNFYLSHGLQELEYTDGATNEERQPDLRMAWPGVDRHTFYASLEAKAHTELDYLQRHVSAIRAVVATNSESE
jgi:GNAT superfamily N-acetyltransferase